MSRAFQREKKTDCRNYREVDILPRTENADKAVKGKRGKRQKVSEPKQKDLNDKNSKRYLVQLGNGNFGIGDIHQTATYSPEFLPETIEEAENIMSNFLRRVDYRRKVLGLERLKYILVTEYNSSKDGETIKRIHHHIIMNGGIDRDDLELMWTLTRINWRKVYGEPGYRESIKQIGWVNADRIQVNENGIEALCKYLTKDPQGKKRWSSSRNLERPIQQPNADYKYTKKQIERIAKTPDCGRDFFTSRFPDFNIVSIIPEFHEETGWHIYMKMWRKQDKWKPEGRRKIEMPVPKGLSPELEEAWGNAWSYNGRPPGKFIGSVKQGNRTFYLYKHGNDYYYENDYDREMREQQRERRRNRERRVGKTDS